MAGVSKQIRIALYNKKHMQSDTLLHFTFSYENYDLNINYNLYLLHTGLHILNICSMCNL